jgi:hypothetical protein
MHHKVKTKRLEPGRGSMDRAKACLVAGVLVGVALYGIACTRAGSPAGSGSTALEGTYRAHSGPNTLELKGATWTLTTGSRVFSGKFVVAQDQMVILLTFANHPVYQDFCRTDMDVYTWTLVDRSLTLRTKGTTATDRATARACNTVADQVFRNGPWTKTG